MNIGGWIKEHPYGTGGIVLGVGVILILVFASGGGEEQQGQQVYANNEGVYRDAYDTQLQMAQIGAQAQTAQTNAAAGVSMAQITAALQLGSADVARQSKGDDLAAAIAGSQIAAQADTQKLVASLSAQVSQSEIDARKTVEIQNLMTQFKMGELQADTTKFIATTQAQMQKDNQAAILASQAQQAASYIAIFNAQSAERQQQAAYAFTNANNQMSLISQSIWANAGTGMAA